MRWRWGEDPGRVEGAWGWDFHLHFSRRPADDGAEGEAAGGPTATTRSGTSRRWPFDPSCAWSGEDAGKARRGDDLEGR